MSEESTPTPTDFGRQYDNLVSVNPDLIMLLDEVRKKMFDSENDVLAHAFWRSKYEILHEQCIRQSRGF